MRKDVSLERRVLIVDDDDGLRMLLESLLEGAGYAPLAAETGEQAIELARRERPGAVLLDVHLPGASGYAVCRALREEQGDGIAIVFISGERIESFDRVAGLLLGGDDYIVKPF